MKVRALAVIVAALTGAPCLAAPSVIEQAYIDRLVLGDTHERRLVTREMIAGGATKSDVLDVAAELLLRNYLEGSKGIANSDSLALFCKLLGASRNGRYRGVVAKVANDLPVRNKVHGYCAKAAKSLPKSSAATYQAGTVDIEALRTAAESRRP